MIVNFQVRFAGNRVSRILTNLKRSQSPGYAARIKMTDLAEKALAFLKSHFPTGTGYPKDNENPKTAYEGHLQSGWKVETLKSGQMFGFDFRNVIAERSEHAKKVLHYLDAGTRDKDIQLMHGAKFVDRRPLLNYLTMSSGASSGIVSMWEGMTIRRPARAALRYYDKTRQDILTYLLPEIRQRITDRLAKV